VFQWNFFPEQVLEYWVQATYIPSSWGNVPKHKILTCKFLDNLELVEVNTLQDNINFKIISNSNIATQKADQFEITATRL